MKSNLTLMEVWFFNKHRRYLFEAIRFSGLVEIGADSADIALTHILNGYSYRKTSATKMNETSSRSHCIVIVKVGTGALIFSDLAGSERIDRSGVTGTGKAEAGNINKTLTALGRVIRSLVSKEKYVPFRDSKLTGVLKNVMLQSERICFIATISSSESNTIETWGTLNFAKNTKRMRIKIHHIVPEASLEELKAENERLKSENEALKIEKESLKRKASSTKVEGFEFMRMQEDVVAYKELIKNNPSITALKGEKEVLEERLQESKEKIDALTREKEELQKINDQLQRINLDYFDRINEMDTEIADMEQQARGVQNRLSLTFKGAQK